MQADALISVWFLQSCAHKPFESMGEERIRKFHINGFFIFFIFMMSLKWLSSTRQQDMKVKKFKHPSHFWLCARTQYRSLTIFEEFLKKKLGN